MQHSRLESCSCSAPFSLATGAYISFSSDGITGAPPAGDVSAAPLPSQALQAPRRPMAREPWFSGGWCQVAGGASAGGQAARPCSSKALEGVACRTIGRTAHWPRFARARSRSVGLYWCPQSAILLFIPRILHLLFLLTSYCVIVPLLSLPFFILSPFINHYRSPSLVPLLSPWIVSSLSFFDLPSPAVQRVCVSACIPRTTRSSIPSTT